MSYTCGSTAVILVVHNNDVYVANVGDSRAIMNTSIGHIDLTVDHKPDSKKELERIKSLGGFVERDPMGTYRLNGSLAMSRSIGDAYLYPHLSNDPDIFNYKIERGKNKFIVIATDGLWDVFTSKEVNDYILVNMNRLEYTSKSLSKVGSNLIIEARQRGSGDNINVIVIMLD
jgi:serine/threonine protein phosphatase PrpC